MAFYFPLDFYIVFLFYNVSSLCVYIGKDVEYKHLYALKSLYQRIIVSHHRFSKFAEDYNRNIRITKADGQEKNIIKTPLELFFSIITTTFAEETKKQETKFGVA